MTLALVRRVPIFISRNTQGGTAAPGAQVRQEDLEGVGEVTGAPRQSAGATLICRRLGREASHGLFLYDFWLGRDRPLPEKVNEYI